MNVFLGLNMDERNLPNRKWLRHEMPIRSVDRYPVFFITICRQHRGRNQLAHAEVWSFLLESIEMRNREGMWNCRQFLAMPDHVHGIFAFDGVDQMKRVIPQWKRWDSGQRGIVWQKGFFDHRLRSEESSMEKREYIRQNPVRAGFVTEASDWKHRFEVR